MTDAPTPAPRAARSAARSIAGLCIGLITAVFLAGVAGGYLAESAKHGSTPVSPRFGATLVGLTVAAVTLYLFTPSLPSWQKLSPRRRLYWGSLGFSALVGGV
ncbi:MAG: hypothetical protein RLZZ58_2163, partial [Pseudomonadota bacterium]